jgi:cation diffusion facilitator CzcD-associated flavoprotein CzcO
MFTPKDKLGDWFESYATLLDLNVWIDTKLKSSAWSKDSSSWTITLKRGQESPREFHPRHVIFCTGYAGEPKLTIFPGQNDFKGIVYHGTEHKDASAAGDTAGKSVLVVGTGNSGHDIAQNYCENGANVTMLQRGPTYVINPDIGLDMLVGSLYTDNGPPIDDADLYAQSIPIPVSLALARLSTPAIAEAEKETLQGLDKAGFKLNDGLDGSGLFGLFLTRGGGYYLDVGCSKLIIDGKIKIEQSPQGVQGFEGDGVVIGDGKKLKADIVVLATGYDTMRTSLRKILGSEVADSCKDVWDLDDEGEINAVSSKHSLLILVIL